MAEDNDDFNQAWYDSKTAMMEKTLGKEHNMVLHALIPYAIGGALDLYYFTGRIAGTAIATKELCEAPGEGSSNRVYDCYELVMFTKHALNMEQSRDESTTFGKAHQNIARILNPIARYSEQASLNPLETMEFPSDFEDIGGKCLLLDGIARYQLPNGKMFGLLAIIEVFRKEMKFAMKNGSGKLIEKLKAAGHYPYSDMERKSVIGGLFGF